MAGMRIGSLFSGYGGLDRACETFFDATTAWHVEYDDAPSRVLAHHWPGVPNHGDITTIDWDSVEPIDILTGGYPCQPFSVAGRRKGTDDERHLWPYVREAIRHLRPRFTVLENVAGHRSMGLDRVLGAEDGLHVRWCSVRASDVGASHRRERLFILAAPADAASDGRARINDGSGITAARGGWEWIAGRGSGLHAGPVALLPTPRATDGTKGGPNQRGSSGDLMLPSAVMRLLPTPRTSDTNGAGAHGDGGLDLRTAVLQWGDYAPAITRQEALSRPAPPPTEPNTKGNPRLSAAFPEWMMFLPAGWVTDPAIGLSRNEQLKCIGNGVVPPQAFAALGILTSMAVAA